MNSIFTNFVFEDVLNPRDSAKFIVNNAETNLIKINNEAVVEVAEIICNSTLTEIGQLNFDECEFHPKSADKAAVDWIFFMDTINFSFWPNEEINHWEITHNGTTQSGYFGVCVAINRALENGIPLTSADYMANIDEEIVKEIFRGDRDVSIPLLNKRMEMIRENGKILVEKFGGSFYNCLLKCSNSALNLLQLIIENFPNFRDFAEYRGRKVSFLKRAQILVADVYSCLHGKDSNADFTDINKLTMFADYRVPQALAYLNVLEYGNGLLENLKNNKLLKCGGEEEVQIRGFSIEACELILNEIKNICETRKNSINPETFKKLNNFTCVDVDVWLWLWRRANAQKIEESVPFHKCRSIFY
uniref:Queuosine 5'-phosphate N-glycosylase/hydrolase n=1 Tax=Meloidogyne enterolobii TaxID=390850 RepID=A0A6V7TU34_MELEN|nr:unnamed protein product [Meloidogyne enterolobii]